MGEEFKDFEVEAPVLTLEPDLTEEKEEIAANQATLDDGQSHRNLQWRNRCYLHRNRKS